MQFRLCRTPLETKSSWTSQGLNEWTLQADANLPVRPIVCAEGTTIGWLLGFPLAHAGELPSPPDAVTFPGVRGSLPSGFEPWLYSFGGRFIAIAAVPGFERLYLDPCGSLSVVYCPAEAIATSSLFLIPYSESTQDDPELLAAFRIPETNAYYAFGLTPRRGVHRLLPNHYLDLRLFADVRHWPSESVEPVNDRDIDGQIVRIVSAVRRNIEGIVGKRGALLAMTAGEDSRMLLACARAFRADLELYTLVYDSRSELDAVAASQVASRFDLRHSTVRYIKPQPTDGEHWLYRTGCCAGELRGLIAAPMYAALPPHRPQLIGMGGEVGRAYLWKETDDEDTAIPAVELIDRLDLPAIAPVVRAAERWQSRLPVRNWLSRLGLLFLEQRVGCWGGVWPYGYAAVTGVQHFPFCHRVIVEALLRLPPGFQRTHGVTPAVIQREWPELLSLPFNRLTGVYRIRHAAKRRLSRFTKLLTKK
jgi:hypothetical protein